MQNKFESGEHIPVTYEQIVQSIKDKKLDHPDTRELFSQWISQRELELQHAMQGLSEEDAAKVSDRGSIETQYLVTRMLVDAGPEYLDIAFEKISGADPEQGDHGDIGLEMMVQQTYNHEFLVKVEALAREIEQKLAERNSQ